MSNSADLLRALADRVSCAPVPRGTGRYHYVHTSGWYRHTIRTADRSGVQVRSVSTDFLDRHQWIAPDGSGRLLVIQGETAVRPSGHYPPGRLPADFLAATDLPTITDRLQRKSRSESTASAMKSFTTVWQTQVVPPRLQQLLLLYLAQQHDLTMEGPIEDRLGRSGLAISHVDPDRHVQHRLLLHEENGMLLTSQNVDADSSAEADAAPTIINCTMWLDAYYATTTESSS